MNKVIYTILFILFVRNVTSQIVYKNSNKNLDVNSEVYYFEDKTNSLTINQVIENNDFDLVQKQIPNFGITSSSIWLKIPIKNTTLIPNLILQIDQPIIDEIEFYSYDSLTNFFNKIRYGEIQRFINRKYLIPEYLFDLIIPTGLTNTYYLKIKCKENMQIPMSIGTHLTIFNQSILNHVFSGIYMGIMLAMILYNLFIYRIFRDKTYIYYSIYIVLTMLTQVSLQGYTFQLLWPNLSWLAIYSPFLFPSLVSIAGLEFFKQFQLMFEKRSALEFHRL